ncbi:MAG TPA: dephospho-CoA kinase [Verrucomicrobiales bacterium]|nr:dephospho-CoA kinase [Verrucomicrobiales bacterium]
MKLIGLTGGVGMGKSTSASLLRDRGLPLIDTDEIARQIVEPGQPALAEIRATFGDTVIDASGRLKRDALARIVFASESRRKDLEGITHPRIRERWERQVATWRAEGRGAGVVVIPLLYETRCEASFDHVVCIACSPHSQHQRLLRRGWSAEECTRRREAQWPIDRKMAAAQFVIWTEGDLHVHGAQWDRVLRHLGLLIG